jgi:hypothetical protein
MRTANDVSRLGLGKRQDFTPDAGPHGPSAVAKTLERSSDAVANYLARLAEAKKVREVSDRPRRCSVAA